ncbi:hypothetical protein [Natronospora cellulosivora (SeqCode)]
MNDTKGSITSTAKDILDQIKYQVSDYEFRLIDENDYPHLDLNYYKNMEQKLEKMEFRKLADVDPMKNKYNYMDKGIFSRIMNNNSNTVCANIVQLKLKFWFRILTWFMGYGKNKVYTFRTEFSNGMFLTTTTMSPKAFLLELDSHYFSKQFCSPKENLEDVYEKHLRKVEEIKQSYSVVEVENDTTEKIFKSVNRYTKSAREHLQSIGWVNKEMLKLWIKDDKLRECIYQEIKYILNQDGSNMIKK